MMGPPPAGALPGRTDSVGRPLAPVMLAALPAPCLGDFITDRADDRLRDLLAFAMAIEAARPMEPDALRRQAEAELQAHAFRTLHNQAEAIRLDAARDQIARLHRGPGFLTILLANLLAIGLVLGAAYAIWLRPGLLPAGVF